MSHLISSMSPEFSMSHLLTLGSVMIILVALLLKQVKKNLSVKAKARRFAKA